MRVWSSSEPAIGRTRSVSVSLPARTTHSRPLARTRVPGLYAASAIRDAQGYGKSFERDGPLGLGRGEHHGLEASVFEGAHHLWRNVIENCRQVVRAPHQR